MARQDGFFIVDGLFHTDLPIAFTQITDDSFGVNDAVYRTADGQKVITFQSPQILEYGDHRDYYHRRKILVQAWKADWGEESLMTVFMAEQLRELYENQKPFWIQYDDEMSRCWGRCIGFDADLNDGNAPHVYFTPHYPIFPYGHEPPDDPNTATAWDGMFMVGRTVWTSGTYSVYPDYGMVVINADGRRYSDRIKTHLKYTWRGYVRIRELQLAPFKLAQTYYTGMVVFEQVAVPITGVPLEWRDPPYTGICTYYDRIRTSTRAKLAIVSTVSAIRYAHVVAPSAVNGQVVVMAKVMATKTSVAYRYGRSLVSPIRIVVPGTGTISIVVGTIGAGLGSGMGGTISETGVGWGTSTSTKTASEILNDNDSKTYIYGSTYSQRFKLDTFADPLINTGHTLTVTWRRGSAINTTLTVRLLQGALVIATPTFTQVVDGDVVSTYTLSGAQADLISDYANLYIEFYADYQAVITGFTIEIPLPGSGIKTRSVTGNITVSASVKAQRPPIIGYPILAQITVKCLPSVGLVAYAVNIDVE